MNMTTQVKDAIELHKRELSVKRRIAQAEFDKEFEMLEKAEKWVRLIEEDTDKNEASTEQ